MTAQQTLPTPAATLVDVLSHCSREELADIATAAIDLLDAIDGDPDAEDACDVEDDFSFSQIVRRYHLAVGPGCPISDGPEEDDPQGACDEDEISTNGTHHRVGLLALKRSGPGCFATEGGRPWPF